LIGLDGTPDSLLSVDAVAARHWPAGTEARIVVVLNGVVWVTGDPGQPSSVKWVDGDDEEDHEWVRSVFTPAEKRLTAAGLATSMSFPGGRPKRVLVEEAETWSADSIFVGAKGMRGVDRFLLGSVAAAVAARASCSVEVVRPKLVK
jgi:nucleotide-binding universal stress UspA family protein